MGRGKKGWTSTSFRGTYASENSKYVNDLVAEAVSVRRIGRGEGGRGDLSTYVDRRIQIGNAHHCACVTFFLDTLHAHTNPISTCT